VGFYALKARLQAYINLSEITLYLYKILYLSFMF